MFMTSAQLIAFAVFNLAIIGTSVYALLAIRTEKRREPTAEWASRLRESISVELEGFRATLGPIQRDHKDLKDKIDDIDAREKRHFSSLNGQIRSYLKTDDEGEDEDGKPDSDLLLAFLQQAAQREQERAAVATQPPEPDIPREPTIPGLIQNGAPNEPQS